MAIMPEATAGVYAIRNRRTGCVYVGSSIDIARRWRCHRGALIRGKHHNRALQRAWTEDGEATFDVVVLATIAAGRYFGPSLTPQPAPSVFAAENDWIERFAPSVYNGRGHPWMTAKAAA